MENKHTTDYRYDANGERICKYSDLGETIYASGYYTETDGKKISKHIYIGSTRVASQVMSRSCETSTTMKRENTLYYHTDHLGSSGYVTDKKGEFYEHTEYTSSGESWVNEKVTGNANLPFKYTGKEMDAETGLYYHGARYRDAKTGVWLSVDPYLANGNYFPVPPVNDEAKDKNKNLPGMGGIFNSVNLNAYHYAGNNPIKYIDPDGNFDRPSHEVITRKNVSAVKFTNFTDKQIKLIISTARNLDGVRSPKPWKGEKFDQSFHFNTNGPGKKDSRLEWADKMAIKAKMNLQIADLAEKAGDLKGAESLRNMAAEEIGIGLHAIQDYYSHSDDVTYSIMGFKMHKDSPEIDDQSINVKAAGLAEKKGKEYLQDIYRSADKNKRK